MGDIMLAYMIAAILISTFFAKKATLKNRGYDIERSFRIQLVEGLVKIVVFSCIPICMISFKCKINEWESVYIFIIQFIIVMLFINTNIINNILSKRKKKAINLLSKNDEDDDSIEEVYSYYKQYIPVFFTWFIKYFVIYFLILIPLLMTIVFELDDFNSYNQEVIKVVTELKDIFDLPLIFIAIVFLSELDVIFSCYQYKNFKTRTKTMTQKLSREEKNHINDWMNQVDKDEKQL